MSKQLTLSAVFSTLAMAAFAFLAVPQASQAKDTGATTEAAAPRFETLLPRP